MQGRGDILPRILRIWCGKLVVAHLFMLVLCMRVRWYAKFSVGPVIIVSVIANLDGADGLVNGGRCPCV